jgi:outer membrane protein TolC
MTTAATSLTTIAVRVVSEQAAYDLLAARYAAGTVAQIDVLTAQTSLISAQIEQVIAHTVLRQQLAELARTIEQPIDE